MFDSTEKMKDPIFLRTKTVFVFYPSGIFQAMSKVFKTKVSHSIIRYNILIISNRFPQFVPFPMVIDCLPFYEPSLVHVERTFFYIS